MRTKVLRRAAAGRRVKRKPARGLAKRFLISLDPKVANKVKKAARHSTGGNLSAWFALAAEDRLRYESLDDLLAWFEEKNGPITQQELDEVDRIWPKG